MDKVISQGKTYDIVDKTVNDGKLYQKVGKRYTPICDLRAHDGLSEGYWLVRVDKNCTSIHQAIDPDNAAVEHAFQIAEDKLTKILIKASVARFRTSTPLTKKEVKAIKAYNDVMGGSKNLFFEYQSLQDMAKEIIRELTKK